MHQRLLRLIIASLAGASLLLSSCTDSADSSESSSDPTSEDQSDAGSGESEEAGDTADFSAVEPVVESYLAEHDLEGAGLVVVQADEGVVFEEYWGNFDEERVSLIASSSKMLSAGVLLRLADQGLLEMDTPIVDQLDWEGDPAITPAQLVSNSSGLVGLLPDPTYAPYLCQYVSAGSGNLAECGNTILTTGEDDADVVPPDTEFRYGGGQWQVAGAVAEAASGRSWADLIDETYVQPCGVDSLAYNNHFTQLPSDDPFYYPPDFDGDPSVLAPTDNPNIEGGAYIDAPDYAQLLLMHLRGGMCGEEQVLSQEALDTMHGDRIAAAYGGNAGFEGEGDPSSGYGMGWWVDRESGLIQDPGAYGAVALLDPENGWGAYLVIEASSDEGIELSGQLEDLLAEAVGAA